MVFSGVVNCISLSFVSNARVTIPPHIMHYHILSLDRHSNEQIRKLSKTCAERCNGGCAKFFRQMTFDERPRKPPPPPPETRAQENARETTKHVVLTVLFQNPILKSFLAQLAHGRVLQFKTSHMNS